MRPGVAAGLWLAWAFAAGAQQAGSDLQKAVEEFKIQTRTWGLREDSLRRYRELTDLYRNFALQLENPREGGAALSTILSRIQSAVAMAEEDPRQLSVLNEQARRIQRKVSGR